MLRFYLVKIYVKPLLWCVFWLNNGMLNALKWIVKVLGYVYTSIRLIILCFRIRKISRINDKINQDKEIADAIKAGDTKKIAQLIEYYRQNYEGKD